MAMEDGVEIDGSVKPGREFAHQFLQEFGTGGALAEGRQSPLVMTGDDDRAGVSDSPVEPPPGPPTELFGAIDQNDMSLIDDFGKVPVSLFTRVRVIRVQSDPCDLALESVGKLLQQSGLAATVGTEDDAPFSVSPEPLQDEVDPAIAEPVRQAVDTPTREGIFGRPGNRRAQVHGVFGRDPRLKV